MAFRFSWSSFIALGAVLVHLYLYFRLVRPLVRGRPGRLFAAGVLVLLTALLGGRRTILTAFGEEARRALTSVAFTWMGIAVCLLVATLATDVVRLVAWVRRRIARVPAAPPDESRRLLLKTLGLSPVIAGGALAGFGAWRAYAAPEVTETALRLAKLPKALDGVSIVQLTDLHLGPFLDGRYVTELVRQANALRPDLLVITGDLTDGSVEELARAVAPLAELKARFGTYFVTGNHDYFSDDLAWTQHLATLGIRPLRNEQVRIGDGGGHFALVGVDDWSGGRRRGKRGYDLDRALEGRDPDLATVLLAHQPANFRVAASRGVDLQISGHTHGGQLFPMTSLIQLAWEHTAGLYTEGHSHLYVSRGCGFWGPPMRVGSAPELAKLVLTA